MMPVLLEIARLKKKALLFVALLLVANICLYVGIDYYLRPELSSTQLQWSELRRKVAASARMDVNALYKQSKDDLAKIAERLPLKREFPRLLGDILEIADANNLASGNISYKPEMVKDHNLQAYAVTMNVSGSYAGIKSFLSDILEIDEMAVIDSLAISQSDQMTEKVTMSLKLTVFMREGA
jgi:type IV pilus assembly protein PilO